MFRNMRRAKQELTSDECWKILRCGEYGVLAVQGDGGYPYSMPLNYVAHDGKLYFHSAKAGHKIDALSHSDKVSFCVVDKSDLAPEKFTTYFRSVIVFGKMHVVEERAEAETALAELTKTLTPSESDASMRAELDSCWLRDTVTMLVLEPEHVSGKQAIELVGAPDA